MAAWCMQWTQITKWCLRNVSNHCRQTCTSRRASRQDFTTSANRRDLHYASFENAVRSGIFAHLPRTVQSGRTQGDQQDVGTVISVDDYVGQTFYIFNDTTQYCYRVSVGQMVEDSQQHELQHFSDNTYPFWRKLFPKRKTVPGRHTVVFGRM